MAASDNEDDRLARKARADAIRRARDARAKSRDTPESGEAKDSAGPASEPCADTEEGSEPSGSEPNYVDLIDKKMRELDER